MVYLRFIQLDLTVRVGKDAIFWSDQSNSHPKKHSSTEVDHALRCGAVWRSERNIIRCHAENPFFDIGAGGAVWCGADLSSPKVRGAMWCCRTIRKNCLHRPKQPPRMRSNNYAAELTTYFRFVCRN